MTEPLLIMKGLRISGLSDDSWHEIVHGVDLHLMRGEVLGLIGESGAGKSTIGMASMGYSRDGCRISGGSVAFDGMELTRASEEELRRLRGRRIAYVAQSAAASFNPAHRLIDQYAEGPMLHGVATRAEAYKDAQSLYARLRLPGAREIGFRYPHQVSGGQLQRAMTAMAMSCRPDLIVFDEPTTALDVTTQIQVLAAIREVVDQFGTAAIYITHDLAVVAQMADRIMVLRHGNVVEEGETRQMLAAPKMQYTRSLLSTRTYRKDGPAAAEATGLPLLVVKSVNAGYGGLQVLHDVSLDVPQQRTVAIVGESGSGKSTIARVIAGLTPLTSGTVTFEGEELRPGVSGRAKEQLRRLQIIYQMPDTALNPRQRVGEIIGRPLSFYLGMNGRDRDRRVAELLEMVELPAEFAKRYPGELSGGQKQRVCIARAIAAQPRMIICDEVTSALDQLVAEGILKLLQRLQDELGVSYLFITHDVATVRAIADEVVVMCAGRVVERGGKDEVLNAPRSDYTKLLLSSVPETDPDWLDRVLGIAAQEGSGDSASAVASA